MCSGTKHLPHSAVWERSANLQIININQLLPSSWHAPHWGRKRLQRLMIMARMGMKVANARIQEFAQWFAGMYEDLGNLWKQWQTFDDHCSILQSNRSALAADAGRLALDAGMLTPFETFGNGPEGFQTRARPHKNHQEPCRFGTKQCRQRMHGMYRNVGLPCHLAASVHTSHGLVSTESAAALLLWSVLLLLLRLRTKITHALYAGFLTSGPPLKPSKFRLEMGNCNASKNHTNNRPFQYQPFESKGEENKL